MQPKIEGALKVRIKNVLPDEELKADWMKRAALFLCDLLDATMDQDLECGGLYHAVHGLILYRDRLYGAAPAATADGSSASGATAAKATEGPNVVSE